MGGNRRRHSRQIVGSPVYADFGPSSGGLVLNLSEDGLAARLVGLLASNQLIHLGFDLPGTNNSIEASGRVAWTDESGERAGVQFLDLPERSKQQIKEWLSLQALSGGLQEPVATQPAAVGAEQFEAPLVPKGMEKQSALSHAADPIVREQPADSATCDPEAAHRSGVTASHSSDDVPDLGKSYELLPSFRAVLLSQRAAREQQRLRKLMLVGISGFLVVLAVVSGMALFGPQYWGMGDMFVDIKRIIAGYTSPSDATQPLKATTHPAKSKPHLRRPGESEGQSGGPGRHSTPSRPEEISKPANRAAPFQLEVVDSNNRRWLLTTRSTRVVKALGGESKDAAVALPESLSVSTSDVPTVGVSQETSGGPPKQQPTPAYPTPALQKNVQGSVVLQAVIGKDGSVQNVRLVSGPPILASAVMEAVKKLRYEPYYRHGEPVEVETQITVDFTISTK